VQTCIKKKSSAKWKTHCSKPGIKETISKHCQRILWWINSEGQQREAAPHEYNQEKETHGVSQIDLLTAFNIIYTFRIHCCQSRIAKKHPFPHWILIDY
jgi:hypothetical protein